MPAKSLRRVAEKGTFSHIYNKGIENKIIFNEDQDYKVFLEYLKEYLTPRLDPQSLKTVFKVNGRTFRGTPHQPKNYFGKVELVAYRLSPDHFHLILHQTTNDAIQSFIRSLCTRYSIYFNKKYKRTGSLFHGPYKSIQVTEETGLTTLMHYLHQSDEMDSYSSYKEYAGLRETSWVKPKIGSLRGMANYKEFVEKYKPDNKEKELLKVISFEGLQHLERRNLTGKIPVKQAQVGTNSKESPSLERRDFKVGRKLVQRIPEVALMSIVFFLLLGLGIRNINASAKPIVLGVVSGSPMPILIPTPQPITKVRVKIDDAAASVNIRKEASVNAEKVGEAIDGQVFDLVSRNSQWYKVQLNDGTGFIFAKYIEVVGKDN